jgi:hypothetical protein
MGIEFNISFTPDAISRLNGCWGILAANVLLLEVADAVCTSSSKAEVLGVAGWE